MIENPSMQKPMRYNILTFYVKNVQKVINNDIMKRMNKILKKQSLEKMNLSKHFKLEIDFQQWQRLREIEEINKAKEILTIMMRD